MTASGPTRESVIVSRRRAVTVRIPFDFMSSLAARIAVLGTRAAIIEAERVLTYAELEEASSRAASALLAGRSDLHEARVAFLIPPSFDYTATLLGIWRAGGVAVPLAVSHPPAELEYVIRDAAAEIVV